MNSKRLSELYFYSCEEIQKLTTHMYEAIHDPQGNPLDNPERVKDIISDYKFKVTQELMAIKEACLEHFEQ